MEINGINEQIVKQCSQLYFRQSMLNDFLLCPQMAMYRWVLDMEESEPFYAAILGTAGHEVVYEMHVRKKLDSTFGELLQDFTRCYNTEMEKQSTNPPIRAGCDSIEEMFEESASEYIQMLQGYQEHERNHDFRSTMHEQSFVLEIQDPMFPDKKPYLFVGQIDQGGVYGDGLRSIRDMKFRAQEFKPSRVEFMLNMQMTIYSAAVKWGNPVCPECKPCYVDDPFGINKELVYNGPCEDCLAMVGTPRWPRELPDVVELVWMRDFIRRPKDQYAKMIKDKSLPKVKSTKSNKMIIAERISDKWLEGGKKGDYMGKCFIPAKRTPEQVQIYMSDVIRICRQIHRGDFWRNPGSHCEFWCKHTDQCTDGLELQVEEAQLHNIKSYSSEDPFGM